MRIGITERGDAGLDLSWLPRVRSGEFEGAIVITKAPQKLLGLSLPENVVIHCTITGLGGSEIEPGVAPTVLTLPAYEALVNEYGPDRVVLRIDPVLPWGWYQAKAREVVRSVRGRLRISFLDAYEHVRRRFQELPDPRDREIPWTGLHADRYCRMSFSSWCQGFLEVATQRKYSVEICSEPDLECTGCVSKLDIKAMGIDPGRLSGSRCHWQRQACCCITEKTEMLSHKGRCKHGCLYCYWRDQE